MWIFAVACLASLSPLRADPAAEVRWQALRAAASPEQLYTLLYALPKGGDLHNHLAGSNIPEWMFAIATDPARNGGDTLYARVRFASAPDAIDPAKRFSTIRHHTYLALPPETQKEFVPLSELTPEERAGWCDALRLSSPGEGRKEFFNVIWARFIPLWRNPAIRFELLVENLKAFGAEGMSYLETQFDVHGLASNDGTPITPEEGLRLLRERLAQPDAVDSGVTARFQFTVLRFAPNAEERLAETYAWVDAHRDLWVAINMAGIEEDGFGYPRRFLEKYRELRARYPEIKLSIHAGEMDGPDRHIRDTLLLGATRIGHAVNLLKDEDTTLLLQQSQRAYIEVNLISNRLLEYVPDLSKHPFPEFLRTGIPCGLNTDDRGMWDSNLTDEYYTAVTLFNLSWAELTGLARSSLAHAFVEEPIKEKLLADYETRLAKFTATLAAGTPEAALTAVVATTKPVTYGYAKRTWGLSFPTAP
ncbi:MAG: adenosine deaminase [Burkholderiales bacterium]|nr:adenosine deaminase [Opitutaceae bacterium]